MGGGLFLEGLQGPACLQEEEDWSRQRVCVHPIGAISC